MQFVGEKDSQATEQTAPRPHGDDDQESPSDNGPFRTLHARNIVAAAFNICNTWAGLSATLYLGFIAGGPVTIIYGFIISSVMVGCCALSMAELAAEHPTAGGQYHWAWLLSPHNIRRGMSYATGMINIFSWIAICSAGCSILPSLVLGLATYWNPTYTTEKWQTFLIYQAANVGVTIQHISFARGAGWTHNIGMALSLLMVSIYFVVCLAYASPKRPSSYVWTDFVNEGTGWSDGIVFLIGIVNPNFSYTGIDGAIHLAEDARNPEKAVPWALVATVLVGFGTAFPFVVAMFYCISDPSLVLGSPVPIFEIWRQATRSDVAATAMLSVALLTGFFALFGAQQTASRLTWSFARDRALVFSDHIGTVHPTLKVPVWALIANSFVVFIMGCIYLGSKEAFYAIVATSVILMHMTFAIVAALKILRGRAVAVIPQDSSRLSWRNLGLLGWVVDFVTVAWGFMALIFYCFPSTTPTTGSLANYASAVLAVMAVFAVINWFVYARKHYQGPRIDLKEIKEPTTKDKGWGGSYAGQITDIVAGHALAMGSPSL